MRLLLDTHAFLWWLVGDSHLSATAAEAINDRRSTVFVSAATAWEVVTKFRLGKLPGAAVIAADVQACIKAQGFIGIPVTVQHGQAAGALPGPHRDPFDRMLIAQSLLEGMTLVSNERLFDVYGIRRLW